MVSALLFAAAAVASSPQEQDLRCVAVMAIVTGKAAEDKRALVAPLMMYYVGRTNGRDPKMDLERELRRVLNDKAKFQSVFQSELARCSKEMNTVGNDLIRIGNILQPGDAAKSK